MLRPPFTLFFIIFSISYVTSETIIPNIVSRLGESVLLPCGEAEHRLLEQLQKNEPGMPVLVNWYKHFSLTRRSDKPIYAKYLANNIDYAPHISKDYEARLQIIDKINLNVTDLRATDEALYECKLVLFDKAFADSQTGSMFYLQVYVTPEFEYPNEEVVYFDASAPVRLYCYAKGKPTPVISWFKNGQRLIANTSVLQEYVSVGDDLTDIYEYRCEAENLIGKIEYTVKVIRSGSLFFTQPLKNLTVTEGTILNWPCLAQSNADVTYKWFKDSVSVQLGLHKWNDRGALFKDGMLYLLETYRNDSGLFECHAFTDNKRIETKAYLNIQYGPEIHSFPSPYYVAEDSESIIIDCEVNSNPPITSLEWFKDKYLLSNTNKYQILSNNSLLIRNIQKADRGNYFCSCNNTIQKAVSTLVNLEIIDTTQIQATNLYIDNYESFKLPCRKATRNKKQIEWFKLNSLLPIDRHSIDSNGNLVIKNLQPVDKGAYFCKIANNKLISSDLTDMINLSMNLNDNIIFSTKLTQYSLKTKTETKHELPLAPTNVRINSTEFGVEIAWKHPIDSPVAISYYQIYYRQVGQSSWKTTESIKPDSTRHFIDKKSFLSGNYNRREYEMKIISFSAFSKSLPSQLNAFTFVEQPEQRRGLNHQTFVSTVGVTLADKMNRFDDLASSELVPVHGLSEIDMILILIFLGLLLICLLCLITCIIYKNSSKRREKIRQNLKTDMDEWGFQSSAATATFLSSASSSEKSFGLFNKLTNKKSKYTSAADSDLMTKIVNYNSPDDDQNNDTNIYTNLYSNYKIAKNSPRNKSLNRVQISTNTNTINRSTHSQQTKNTDSPNATSKITENYSPVSGEVTVTSSVHSSGIHSCDDDESDESIRNVPIRKDGFLNVNTIKYNAKTNIVQQQKFSAKQLHNARKNTSVIREEGEIVENIDRNEISTNYYQFIKSSTESADSNTCSPNTISPSGPIATLSTISIESSSQNSPPFPPVNHHQKVNLDSSLTLVTHKLSPDTESSGMSSSSGCSSYNSKVVSSNYKDSLSTENPDYENLRELEVQLNKSGPIVLREKKYQHFSTNPLGTFRTRRFNGRFDYV